MNEGRILSIDIEGNSLLANTLDYTSLPYKLKPSSRLWTIAITDIDTGEVFCENNERITREWLQETLKGCTILIAHNGIKFDFVIMFLFGLLDYRIGYLNESDTIYGQPVQIIDTLILSRLFNPDRYGGHSLDAWGKRTGDEKIHYRQVCIDNGIIPKDAPQGAEFLQWTPEMDIYCIKDTKVAGDTFKILKKEWDEYPEWSQAIKQENKLADLAIRRETFGFGFDKELALECLEDLTEKMDKITQQINPILPPKVMTKGEMSDFTPPKNQLTIKNLPTANILKFVDKVGATLTTEEDNYYLNYKGFSFQLPYHEPLETHLPATIDNLDHVKMYLMELGWEPTEWRERDLTKDSKKQNLPLIKRTAALDKWWNDTQNGKYKEARIKYLELPEERVYEKLREKIKGDKPVRIPTAPTIRVGVEKELCPNLIKLGDKVSFAKDFAYYLTYKHRKSSIAGGDIEDMDFDTETPNTGFLSMYREEDGRVATPAIEIGASCVVAETDILTFDGLKKIIDVKVGDKVLTHSGRYKEVIDFIKNGIKDVYKVKLNNELTLTCTENHPFWTNQGWMTCKDIRPGTKIFHYGEKEIWGIHPDFPLYKVSSWGRVLNKYGKNLKPLSVQVSGRPYTVDLYDGSGQKRRRSVAKLVCETFNGLQPNGLETRHLDGNSHNNNIKNLRFGTSQENSQDTFLHGGIKKLRDNRIIKLSDDQINEIITYCTNKEFKYGDDTRLAKIYNVSREHIRDIRKGKRRVHKATESLYREKYDLSEVESVVYIGKQETFDLTIEEDHSYVANNIVTHNTNRYRHIGICNIARASSIYGKEMRSLFGSGDKGLELGFDFASLEARIQGHYCWKYTNGEELAKDLLAEKPNDIHTKRGLLLNIKRDDAKSINYMLLYGGQIAKVMKMLACDKVRGTEVFDGFWDNTPALKELRDALEAFWNRTGKTYVLGIDGRKIMTRSKHSLLNALFQSAGVICAKYVTIMMFQELERKGYCTNPFEGIPDIISMIEYHDESQLFVNQRLMKFKTFDTEEQAKVFIAEWKGEQLSALSQGTKWYVVLPNDVSNSINNAIRKTEKLVNLNVPLGFEWVVNKTWYGCH